MVCDRSYLPSLTQTAYMCGYIFGGLFAFLSDKFGRRKIILVSYTVNIIGIISCAFSVNIYQYIFSRFLQSFGGILGMGWEAFGKTISKRINHFNHFNHLFSYFSR